MEQAGLDDVGDSVQKVSIPVQTIVLQAVSSALLEKAVARNDTSSTRVVLCMLREAMVKRCRLIAKVLTVFLQDTPGLLQTQWHFHACYHEQLQMD